jgi:arsenate reductase
LFRENNIGYDRVNYFVEPLGEAKLRELLKKADLKPFDVLRKGEAVFKDLKLSKDTPDDEIIRAVVENPSLLQRPIVEVGERAVLARPVEKALELIK